MAVAYPHYSLRLSAIRTPTKTLKPSQNGTLTPRSSHFHLSCKSNLGFPTILFSPVARRPFKASLNTAESDSTLVDVEEADVNNKKQEADVDQKRPPSLKTLIEVYKEAILDGDEKSVSDIEAMICQMENEKNGLLQKVAGLSADITSGKDRFLRLKADFENSRKRSENDRLTLTSDVRREVIESLLPMVDNFERAKQQAKSGTEKEKKIDTSYQGIYKQFVETMRSLCVSIVETVGKPFNPSVHEAIARVESQEFKEGIVIQEVRRGFVLGDRLLRPAVVKVSTGVSPKKALDASEESVEQPITASGSDDGSVPSY
ncbi:co-chaperone GrpE family protein [Tasmannia lanceolata]|uniref:co-chaperone GrpE family protein n=1 Tax=Tasmannia lanceolata TaxID=3420 RepID=UPI004064167D